MLSGKQIIMEILNKWEITNKSLQCYWDSYPQEVNLDTLRVGKGYKGAGGMQNLRKDGGFANWLLIDFSSSSALLRVVSSSPVNLAPWGSTKEAQSILSPDINPKKTGTRYYLYRYSQSLAQCPAHDRHLNDPCVSAVPISHNLEKMARNENNKFLLGELQVTQLYSRQETKTEEGLSHTQRYLWVLTMTNFSGVCM